MVKEAEMAHVILMPLTYLVNSFLALTFCFLLVRRFNLLIENKDDLAKLMVLEQGKPLAEAAGEVIFSQFSSVACLSYILFSLCSIYVSPKLELFG